MPKTKRKKKEILKNGAILLQRWKGKDINFVLAEMEGSPAPYVTWAEDMSGNTFWGHYFVNITSAAKDFEKRIEREKKAGG